MSLITTPPPLRRAIKTHLVHKEDEIVRSAICQEIGRGGQIFYVVPRVDGIELVATKLRSMVPNLKLLIAHGELCPLYLLPVSMATTTAVFPINFLDRVSQTINIDLNKLV